MNRRFYLERQGLPEIAPIPRITVKPVDVTDAVAFPNFARAIDHARQLRERNTRHG